MQAFDYVCMSVVAASTDGFVSAYGLCWLLPTFHRA